MTDAWGPLALPWRVIQRRDLVIGQDGGPLFVDRIGPGTDGQLWARLLGAGEWTGVVDPEGYVNVLVPLAERDAIRTLREAGIVDDILGRAA